LNSDQETVNEVRAVMGIDFTLEHFYSLLVTGYPLCMDEKYTCFVMDSSGYLVIHNDFIEANGDINIEHLHITEIEPDIAQDLIIPQGFLSKSKCVNLQTIKQQNYYVATRQSNIDNLDDVNPCRRYQMFNIPNTNVYLGIIDKSKCSDNDETPCACG
ncbi:VWFA and cache domain-containing protein 1-like, partial [Saccoglossus kowalevskii]